MRGRRATPRKHCTSSRATVALVGIISFFYGTTDDQAAVVAGLNGVRKWSLDGRIRVSIGSSLLTIVGNGSGLFVVVVSTRCSLLVVVVSTSCSLLVVVVSTRCSLLVVGVGVVCQRWPVSPNRPTPSCPFCQNGMLTVTPRCPIPITYHKHGLWCTW